MKRLLIGLSVVVVGLLVVGAGALLLVDANHFRPQVEASLGQALGRKVSVGKLHLDIASGSLAASDIRIGEDPAFGEQPFVRARSLELGAKWWPLLLRRELHITALTLDEPVVRLMQDRRGAWNVAGLGGTAPPTPASSPRGRDAAPVRLTVDRLRIRDGRIELVRMAGDRTVYERVQLSADRVDPRTAFPFTLKAALAGGGTLALEGKFGPWHAGNSLLTQVGAQLSMRGLDLVGAGLMARGSGVGGVLDVTAQLAANQGVLVSDGRIEARRLQLVAAGAPAPQPLHIDYRASYRLAAGTGRIDRAMLRNGAAALAIEGGFDNRPAVMRLNLRVNGQRQPVDDLQPLLPAFGVILPQRSRLADGTASMDLTVRGPLDALVIRGPVSLDDTRLAGYSLGAKLGGALALAGIAAPRDTVIRHAEATLTMSPAGIDADPVRAQIAQLGSLVGKGRMAADGGLDFRMRVKLDRAVTGEGQAGATGQGPAGLLGGSKAAGALGGVLGGITTQGVGVHVGGTASAPSFKLDPRASVELLEAGMRGKSAAPATPQSKPPARSMDVLDSLLQDALKPRQPPSGH